MAYDGTITSKFGLAFDTETSGCNRGNAVNPATGYQIVSIGMEIVDLQTFESVDKLYIEIQHDPKFKWEAGAQAVHGLSREYLEKNGVTMQDAALIILNFLYPYFADTYITAVGHRVAFDIAFMDALLAESGLELKWERMMIDSAGIGAAFLGIAGSDALFSALGLPERTQHNAAEDIEFTVEVIRRMKDLFIGGIHAAASS